MEQWELNLWNKYEKKINKSIIIFNFHPQPFKCYQNYETLKSVLVKNNKTKIKTEMLKLSTKKETKTRHKIMPQNIAQKYIYLPFAIKSHLKF